MWKGDTKKRNAGNAAAIGSNYPNCLEYIGVAIVQSDGMVI